MRITFISDTHNKHKSVTKDLPGGDLLIHAGDISSRGFDREIEDFCKWYHNIDNYQTKIFISGNHDWGFMDQPLTIKGILDTYNSINYLEDNLHMIGENYSDMIKVWGSPWQPEFYNWAFNLPRNGDELKEKWDMIPMNTDILVTHGPAFGYLDTVEYKRHIHLGCELLTERIQVVKPKIHVCGHIHSGRGITYNDGTLFINAAVLDERYEYSQKPITIDYDFSTGEWDVI